MTRPGWKLGIDLRHLVGLLLLVASEALWRWQTWPVRDLLPTTGVAGSTV